MAEDEKPKTANDIKGAVTGESKGARLRRQAVERGRARRAKAVNRGKEGRAPAIKRGEEGRKPAIEAGKRIREIPELRGALRRAAHTNRTALPPPPATGENSERARDLQNATPLNRLLKTVDRARGKQNQ